MNKWYYKVTRGFAESNEHRMAPDGLNKFGYGVTKDGDYFVDKNTLNTHPGLLSGSMPIEQIYITKDMLPDEPPID